MALEHKGAGKDMATHGTDVIYFHFGGKNLVINSKDSSNNAQITG